MKRPYVILGGFLGLSLLIGAGCSNIPTPSNNTIGEPNTKGTSTAETEYPIMLTASAVGNRQVQFVWTLEEDTKEPSRFILVRGSEENPVHDQTNYWFRQHGSNRSATWLNLPPRDQHFRICLSEDGEACDTYSNDLLVEILSGPQTQLAAPVAEKTTE